MSLDALAAWRELLTNLGRLGDALRMAIESDDLVGAIAAMMQLRSTRAALSRVESPLANRGRARGARGDGRRRAPARRRPQRRGHDGPLAAARAPGDERLLATPLGIAVLADSLLPAVWDFEADLVVLVGPALTPVVELLADLGQRRIVQIHGESPRAISVQAIAELAPAVRTLVPGPPNQFVVRALAPTLPGFVEEAVETVQTALQDLRIHRNTVRAFSRTWLDHGLANLPPWRAIRRSPMSAAPSRACRW